MVDSFREFEASSLFCPRCKQANPVRKQLLLVLPDGNKYDYTCSVCGTQVGGKTDSDSSEFQRMASLRRGRCGRVQIGHRASRSGSTNQGDV